MIHDIHVIHRAGRPISAGATRGRMRPSTRARETGSEGNRRARNQRTAGAERGSGLCGDHRIGKRRAGAGRGGDGRRAARLTSAILIPRRAADQRRISVRSKAATPERSRKPLLARGGWRPERLGAVGAGGDTSPHFRLRPRQPAHGRFAPAVDRHAGLVPASTGRPAPRRGVDPGTSPG
jgi:hypothetical protein